TSCSELEAQDRFRKRTELRFWSHCVKPFTKIRYQLTSDISSEMPNRPLPTMSLRVMKCKIPPPSAAALSSTGAVAEAAEAAALPRDEAAGAAASGAEPATCARTCSAP